MRTYNLIKNEILEKILDNTANKICQYCYDLYDPDFILDEDGEFFLFYSKTADNLYGHLKLKNSDKKKVKVTHFTNDPLIGYFKHNFDDKEFVGVLINNKRSVENQIYKSMEPLKKKMWKDIAKKYNIETTLIKDFKEIFGKNKKLSLNQIYNQHLLYDDKIAVMSEDLASLCGYNGCKNEYEDYPVFLFNQETIEKIATGYEILKTDTESEIILEEVIKAAESSKKEFITKSYPKINYEDLPKLQQILCNKLKEINKIDKYYFHSINEEDKIFFFLQDHNIEVLSEVSFHQNFTEIMWKTKDKEIVYYPFFKNLHLFDLNINLKNVIERPDDGWICLKYNGDFFFVPKNLASQWLKEII